MTHEERIKLVNEIANGVGQTVLNICGGDWALAESVTATLYASCVVQAAIAADKDPLEHYQEISDRLRVSIEALDEAFNTEEAAHDGP